MARAEASRTFRSARVIVLFALYAMFSVLVLLVVGSIAKAINEQVNAQLESVGGEAEQAELAMTQARQSMLGWLLDSDPALLDALTQVPLVVIILFKTTLFWLPPYVVLLAFDAISGEVGPRSIRYLTIRTRRASILFGKFLAQAGVLLALVLLVDVGIFLYAKFTNPDFGWGLMLVTLLKFSLASIVFSLSYLALTMACSTLFRQPAVSLIFNFFALFVLWLINFAGSFGVKREILETGLPGPEEITSPLAYIRYLTPSYYSTGLIHPAASEFAVSGAAYAGFTVLFLLIAYAVLRARDV